MFLRIQKIVYAKYYNITMHSDVIAIIDSNFRDPFFKNQVFQSDRDFGMYRETDILFLIDCTFHHYNQITKTFRLIPIQELQMSIVCFLFAIKFYTDIEMYKPYTFVWNALTETEYTVLSESLDHWKQVAELYEFILVDRTKSLTLT